jgi:hypothetical protein
MIVYHGTIEIVKSPDKERALKEIKVYDVYDQIAFISQRAIDQLLSFESHYEV